MLPRQLLPTIAVAAVTAAGPVPAHSQRADTVVRIQPSPRHPGTATIVPDISIGAADGADEYLFGDIAEIAVAKDGTIYVFDRQVPALRQYDATGKYVRTLGRSGSGPGEYRTGGGLAVHPDGRVLLWDTGNWRINVYTPAGANLPAWTTPSGSSGSMSLSTSRSLLVDSAGLVYVRRDAFFLRDPSARRVFWIRLHADGRLRDTIPSPSFAANAPGLTATNSAGNATVSAGVPFSAQPIVAMSPLGFFVTAMPVQYAFEILRPGAPVTSVRRPVQPAAVSDRERDSARKAVEERMRKTDPIWTWSGPAVPRTRPAFENVLIGSDGRIWLAIVPENSRRVGSVSGGVGLGGGRVGAPGPARSPGQPEKPRAALYDVFEPDGAYLGRIEIPPRISTVVRRGDYVWGVEYDEDDIPHVKRYRIVWR